MANSNGTTTGRTGEPPRGRRLGASRALEAPSGRRCVLRPNKVTDTLNSPVNRTTDPSRILPPVPRPRDRCAPRPRRAASREAWVCCSWWGGCAATLGSSAASSRASVCEFQNRTTQRGSWLGRDVDQRSGAGRRPLGVLGVGAALRVGQGRPPGALAAPHMGGQECQRTAQAQAAGPFSVQKA